MVLVVVGIKSDALVADHLLACLTIIDVDCLVNLAEQLDGRGDHGNLAEGLVEHRFLGLLLFLCIFGLLGGFDGGLVGGDFDVFGFRLGLRLLLLGD